MSPTPLTSSRARICLVAPEFIGPFPNGGVGTACYWEARALADAGFDVTVLYTGPTDRQTPEHWERTYNAGPFAYVDLWKWAAGGEADAVERADHPCAEARTSELVYRFLRRCRFDLLLFQEFLGHGARTLQARRSGDPLASVPAAVTLHSCRQWIYEGMKRVDVTMGDMYVDFLERESARLADFVLAPSRHMARWAAAHWTTVAPATVVPYCYDNSIEPEARRIDHAGPFEHLVFFGRLETRKGVHLFCRALASSPAARRGVRKVTFLGKASTVEGRPSAEFILDTLGNLPGLQIDIVDSLGSFEALAWLGRQKQTLVVAPSLVDNLPYAVIELYTRRIPFISTRTGGIPEIVGPANAHLLADTTVDSLARLLEDVHMRGVLATDYRDGYSSRMASAAHVDHVRDMLAWRTLATAEPASGCDIVVVDAPRASIDAVRHRFVRFDPSAADARFLSWDAWRFRRDRLRPAIFVTTSVAPRVGSVLRLLSSLSDSRVDAATGYYTTPTPAGTMEIAPLGASLECGWARNVFGGPCLIVRPSAFDSVVRAVERGFDFWPVYAALAIEGRETTLVPEVLFDMTSEMPAEPAETLAQISRQYAALAVHRLDLGWVVQHARAASARGPFAASGHELYDYLLSIPTDQLAAYSGLTFTDSDPMAAGLRRLAQRLGEIAATWQVTQPRVWVYGAGEHTRVVLALQPALGRFIAGFIDRRPVGEFLGRPCVRPEDVHAGMADVILYSSREFERDMYARLASLPVEHVLLYASSPPVEADTTASRLRRRFGHTAAPAGRLGELYAPPSWATGYIGKGDAEFLLELVSGLKPTTVVELGVASGVSSAALLFAMDSLPPDPARHLVSCDVRATCYFDAKRPTGAAVAEMYPSARTRWTLKTDCDARALAQSLEPGCVDLAFIDANHAHPWPVLDLLQLVHVVRPGGWVVLHDIELPRLAPEHQDHGPMWLFEAWPFNKVHGVGASRNIGALQLPEDPAQLVPLALYLLKQPWEDVPEQYHVELSPIFHEVTAALDGRLRRPVEAVAT